MSRQPFVIGDILALFSLISASRVMTFTSESSSATSKSSSDDTTISACKYEEAEIKRRKKGRQGKIEKERRGERDTSKGR